MNKEYPSLYLGDCLDIMRTFPDNVVDSIVTDPPYGIEFLGKEWDRGVPGAPFWEEMLRIAKPGAILLAMGGTRTYHRLVCAIEDAGWEVRDTIAWLYGSGFPKSHDISKSIDRVAKKGWDDLGKAIDNIQTDDIIQVWKKNCNTANIAVRKLKRNQTKVGDSTPKENTAHESVLLTVNLKKSYVSAIIAELSLSEAHLMLEVQPIAHRSAEQNTKQKISNVSFAEKGLQDQFQIQSTEQQAKNSNTITVLLNVREWLKENITRNPRVDEALRTYHGNPKSLSEGDINALCVELIDDLKRITLSQSKTFQNLDTTQQTECVSATSAIITEYTAEHLISFTVDTLKNKALDKAQGAEREVVGISPHFCAGRNHDNFGVAGEGITGQRDRSITAPATPEAQQWDGWGTALKPAMELICVAMKPIDGTYVNNALTWGVAGLWIDGGRVETDEETRRTKGGWQDKGYVGGKAGSHNDFDARPPQGRFPANVIHDGSDEVTGLMPEAARFFYCAKASRSERNAGLEGMEEREWHGQMPKNDPNYVRSDGAVRTQNLPRQNHHPTVKPLALMRYLARLTKTPTGGVVLDPFMGSGTTGIAAVMEGRDFIGIELNAEYLEIAERRIAEAQKQPRLL